MSRLLAEGMVGERMVTDAFAPKARLIVEPLDCQTPEYTFLSHLRVSVSLW
jgi:hypothetical protein